MALRASVTDRALDLPPLYRLVTLREAGDAFAHACAIADNAGAGTLVWTRRFDVAEFAVVLEPEEPLEEARRVFYLGMNALADALATHAPPQRPIGFDWPDAIRVDGVLVGGGRLGWPAAAEDQVPDWLVFSAMVRTVVMRSGEPGLRPFQGGLEEVGFEAIDSGELIESFSRHLMAGFHDWQEQGFAAVAERWKTRLHPAPAPCQDAAAARGSPAAWGEVGTPAGLRSLRATLESPSWRDPATGMPWL